MKDFFLSDCAQHENKVLTSSFVVVSKQVKPKKSGEPYLALTLGDRTGQLEAKMWDNVDEVLEAFEQDDFLKVKGLINKYKQRFQLTIHKLRKLGDSEIEFADYLPKTTKDIDELWKTLSDFVSGFQNQYLKTLVQAFMADPEIAAAYRNAPAAKTLHHAYIGGLLDHVVSLFRSCDLISRNYPLINRDLLLTGAFLHDIGKIAIPEAIMRKPGPLTTEELARTGVHTLHPLSIQTYRTVEKGHGRLEERHIRVSSELEGYSWWPYLVQVFEYTRIWTTKGVTKQQVRHGITSLPATVSSAAQLAALKRGHWQVENGLHYVKDVTLGEDASQTHVGAGADVLAMVRNAKARSRAD